MAAPVKRGVMMDNREKEGVSAAPCAVNQAGPRNTDRKYTGSGMAGVMQRLIPTKYFRELS